MNATVHVDVLILRLVEPGGSRSGLGYRTVRSPLGTGEPPDDAALRVAGQVSICHSTSWRHEAGVVVLTYAALPDPRPSLPGCAVRPGRAVLG